MPDARRSFELGHKFLARITPPVRDRINGTPDCNTEVARPNLCRKLYESQIYSYTTSNRSFIALEF
jgi:hypothetical protein